MGACKTFNLILPYTTYRELKRISIRQDKPIAEIVREGITLVLKNPLCKHGDAKNADN